MRQPKTYCMSHILFSCETGMKMQRILNDKPILLHSILTQTRTRAAFLFPTWVQESGKQAQLHPDRPFSLNPTKTWCRCELKQWVVILHHAVITMATACLFTLVTHTYMAILTLTEPGTQTSFQNVLYPPSALLISINVICSFTMDLKH